MKLAPFLLYKLDSCLVAVSVVFSMTSAVVANAIEKTLQDAVPQPGKIFPQPGKMFPQPGNFHKLTIQSFLCRLAGAKHHHQQTNDGAQQDANGVCPEIEPFS